MLCLSSTSSAQFESHAPWRVMLCSCVSLRLPRARVSLSVPFIYWRICFTAVQCVLLKFVVYCHNFIMGFAISGRVHSIRYMRELIASWYGMSCVSSFLFSSFFLSITAISLGVFDGLQSWRPNFLSTASMYCG